MGEETLKLTDAVNETCPWSGRPIAADALMRYRGHVVGFELPADRDRFAAAVAHFEDAVAARDVPLIARGLD